MWTWSQEQWKSRLKIKSADFSAAPKRPAIRYFLPVMRLLLFFFLQWIFSLKQSSRFQFNLPVGQEDCPARWTTAVCVHEPDVKLLPGNCTWTLTAKLQMDVWNIQDVPTRGFASVDISLFLPYNMSQAPSYQRDTGSLESSKELDISPWQLCDTLEEPGGARDLWRTPQLGSFT